MALATRVPEIRKVNPMKKSFPNIYTVLCILGTIPVTSCECERSVSVLRRLKTYLRNTMTQSRLNGLALMSIHRDVDIDYENVINKFARRFPRRLEFSNILTDTQ